MRSSGGILVRTSDSPSVAEAEAANRQETHRDLITIESRPKPELTILPAENARATRGLDARKRGNVRTEFRTPQPKPACRIASPKKAEAKSEDTAAIAEAEREKRGRDLSKQLPANGEEVGMGGNKLGLGSRLRGKTLKNMTDLTPTFAEWLNDYKQNRPGLKTLQERIDEFIIAHEARLKKTEKAFLKQPKVFLSSKKSGKGKKPGKGGNRFWKNIGLGFKTPREAIEGTYIDKKCPFTGTVSIRGRILAGTCHSAKMNRTIIVRRNYLHYVKKYQRYEKRHSNIPAHISPCFRVKEGDHVIIGQCRPLSKTVRFNVLKVIPAGSTGGGGKKAFVAA
ncbi:hypothetical protein ZIOFF_043180 [Zingiber officinale]|uniref:Small ribosomal subunit protein uS17 N-terminal domain-containing protein n=1 Tax=Zingiber officinale TaxID=94328 RepID=A0A8J5GA92_ZINOF|nr:hypothetical protein ZIOFF_043180 [Zingiber officinale]